MQAIANPRTNALHQQLAAAPGLVAKTLFLSGTILAGSGKRLRYGDLTGSPEQTPSHWLKQPAALLWLAADLDTHAKRVGQRVCQDWQGDPSLSPSRFFSDQERDILHQIFEHENSNMQDYMPGSDRFDDEMCISFALSSAVKLVASHGAPN